jgi:hypothetical protein
VVICVGASITSVCHEYACTKREELLVFHTTTSFWYCWSIGFVHDLEKIFVAFGVSPGLNIQRC